MDATAEHPVAPGMHPPLDDLLVRGPERGDLPGVDQAVHREEPVFEEL
jgi:hypothetical protein